MEAYRKNIRKRVAFVIVYCALVLGICLLGLIGDVASEDAFAVSYLSGFGIGLLAVMLMRLWKYRRALRDETRLKALYVYETDERNRYIDGKTGGTATVFLLCTFALASIAAGFFDRTVFYTLVGSTLFIALAKGSLKLYYHRKV